MRNCQSDNPKELMEKYRLLLVDDDPILLKGIEKVLQEKGFNITSVNNGSDAITLLKEKAFDLVITDLVMDEVDGIAVLKKAKEVSSEIMVIILTGFADMRSAIDALRLDADDYLVKPCDPEEMYFRIKQSLDKYELKREIKKQKSEVECLNQDLLKEIFERKQAAEELQRHKDNLEDLVAERTKSLEEANAALKVILKKRDEDKKELEENVISNTKDLLIPYITKLYETKLKDRQKE